jgi:hypothetical protein
MVRVTSGLLHVDTPSGTCERNPAIRILTGRTGTQDWSCMHEPFDRVKIKESQKRSHTKERGW